MDYKIEIPKPCHQDWEAMTPQAQGRFCGSCQKTVVDFTQMQPHEVQAYFAQNQSQHLCGRFNHDQLDGLRVEVPSHLLQRTYSFQRMFVLAFFISMGAGLVSCTNNNGKTKDVQKVEVVETPVNVTVGALLPPDTFKNQIPPPPPKIEVIGNAIPQPKKVITTVTTTSNSSMGMPSLSPIPPPKTDNVVKPDTLMPHTKGEVKLQPKTNPEIKPVADTLVLKGYKTVKHTSVTGGVRVRPKTENK
jgi:hypothetical protein